MLRELALVDDSFVAVMGVFDLGMGEVGLESRSFFFSSKRIWDFDRCFVTRFLF